MYSKIPLSIPEQIERLKDRGLTIQPQHNTGHFSKRLSYYGLTGNGCEMQACKKINLINMQKFACFFFLIFFISASFAQQKQLNSSEIKLGLEKLGIVGSVLYIAAHPDDENTRLLAYLANERKLRTGYLALTRGDGGQNLIGNEQGEELGLIRTQELLAARKTDGAEQFFTRANDFGFSKSPEETFKIWGKEQILSDVVWIIRKFRPDVIITRFPEDGRGGHGHHTASAILAHEAFTAAADPKQFPEQLKYLQPWKTKRILWNTFNFGGNNTTSEDQLKINVGGFNPLLGKSYGEIAAESRTNHKSQGFGSAAQRGNSFEYFTLIEGLPFKNDLFDGIDQSWGRIDSSNKMPAVVNLINAEFSVDKPYNSIKNLVDLLNKIEKTKDIYWRTQKAGEIKNLIAACAGLWFESTCVSPEAVLDRQVNIRNSILLSSDATVKLTGISSQNVQKNPSITLLKGVVSTDELNVKFPNLTQPYWLVEEHGIGTYTIKDQQLIGYPENPDLPSVIYNFEIEGKAMSFVSPVFFKRTDPVQGEIYQKIAVIPPVSVALEQNLFLLTDQSPKTVPVKIISNATNINGNVSISGSKDLIAPKSDVSYSLKEKGDIEDLSFQIKAANTSTGPTPYDVLLYNGGEKSREVKSISYPHIPKITYMPVTTFKYAYLNLKTAGKQIGYIPGAGDKVAEALNQVGYSVTILTESEILYGDLSKYDAIISGVRFYNVNTNAKLLQSKLLDYTKNGGVFLVQYNVNSNLKSSDIGPYPFAISRDRVTDEDAKVSFNDPGNMVLNYPNKITEKDFEGWIQERGLYFTDNADAKYQTPLMMNDMGEKPNKGALLVADYGKGKFVYTSLAFFRELPAGIPGAYRLFANLIAKPQ